LIYYEANVSENEARYTEAKCRETEAKAQTKKFGLGAVLGAVFVGWFLVCDSLCDLYCVGGDVKPCSIQSNRSLIFVTFTTDIQRYSY